MFSQVKSFIARHKRKFIVGGIFIGGTVLLTRYAQRKLREWQEKETNEFLERTRRQHHFESTERTCNQTILSLAPTVREVVTKLLNTETIVSRLRNGPTDKVHLWEELKVLAFTRAAVFAYATAMLVVTLRIQLNLIGGYMYQDSTREDSRKQSRISGDLQQRYLSLCHHFLNNGIRELCTLLESKVRPILEGVPLKQRLSLRDIEQIFWAIQASVTTDEASPVKSLPKCLLPADQDDCIEKLNSSDAEALQKMILETFDLLESDEVIGLTNSCISHGFSLILDQISEYFSPADCNADLNVQPLGDGQSPAGTSKMPTAGYSNGLATSFVHPNHVTMPMAKLIPIINGLVTQWPGKSGVADPWIQQLILNDKLKLLGANVYEVFSHKEA